MIALALPEHAPLLAALHQQAFRPAWDREAIERLLSTPQVFALIDGRPSGFVIVRVVADEGEILTLAVAPQERRRGTGRLLIQSASQLAATRGAARLFLEVSDDNDAARALYRQEGFEEVGRRRNYYRTHGGDDKDALVFQKALPPAA